MTARTLILRSLRFHWRAHLGVVLGAAIGSAALIGALIVGESVRETLRERALARLGNSDNALFSNDRFFTEELGLGFVGSAPGEASATLLKLSGTLANADGSARANIVQVFGVRNYFEFVRPFTIKTNSSAAEVWRRDTDLPIGGVLLNTALAQRLSARVGDTLLLRVQKPSALSRDAVITPQSDHTVALRLRVNGILDAAHGGDLDLQVSQMPALNAFVRLNELSEAVGIRGKANLVLAGVTRSREPASPLRQLWVRFQSFIPGTRAKSAGRIVLDSSPTQVARLNARLKSRWRIEDAELSVKPINETQAQLGTPRIFLDVATVRAATNYPAAVPPGGLVTQTFIPLPNGNLLSVMSDSGRTNTLIFSNNFRVVGSTVFLTNGGSVVSVPISSSSLKGARPSIAGREQITNAIPILTYLVNQIRAGTNAAPYSMVMAAGAPYTPVDLRDDEIVLNQWLANDLAVKAGDSVALTYFVADQVNTLTEHTNTFRVRSIVPLDGIYADKTLMPEFPGLAKAESTQDWDAGFPLVHKIRDQDEAYWKQHRGTPKAFVSLRAGQQMWSNRFGALTAVRWPVPPKMTAQQFAGVVQENVMENLDPAELGLTFEPIRERALQSVAQSQDFGGLFIGFSFFLILAALILMGLLFVFGVQQRAEEIGTLLALGFTPKRVRRLFLFEGAALAFIGSVIGVAGGIGYARAMLRGLTTVWSSATNATALTFHVSTQTVFIGLVSGTLVAVITIWIVLRKQARQPARALLAGDWGADNFVRANGPDSSRRPGAMRVWTRRILSMQVIAQIALILAIATALSSKMNPEAFFAAGAFALIAGLAFTAWMLGAWSADRQVRRTSGRDRPRSVTFASLAAHGTARRRTRSVATVALLASGVFLIVSIGAFRLDADANAWKRSSGTGGFALIGESTLPIVKDLNTKEGRDALGLDEKILQGATFVPFRVREGDDASCLNLNRAQQPRLLGVRPELLGERKAFSFANVSSWNELKQSNAIGDSASIQWALGKKIGDTLTYIDERGDKLAVRLVGALANSILQGSLIIDEAEFTRRFPGISGYRMFFIDCPSNALPAVSAELTRALQDHGFEVTPAAQRLAAFNAVQNTYLNTFQVLGGLGLLLGSFGLGIVVLRNVLERRGELALLIAVGFRRGRVQKLVLAEHGALLCLGLVIGIVSALVAILPSLMSPRVELPVVSLAITLGGVLLFGIFATWLATRAAVRGNLLEGLRNE